MRDSATGAGATLGKSSDVVRDAADMRGRGGWCGRRGRARSAELQQLYVPVVRDEDVRRLQISVDNAAPVRRAERLSDLHADIEDTGNREWRAGNEFVERAPLQELEHQEWTPALDVRIVHGADVWVTDERRDARLTVEQLHRSRTRRLFEPQQLDRHVAFEPEVARAIDLRRAVTSNRLNELVV